METQILPLANLNVQPERLIISGMRGVNRVIQIYWSANIFVMNWLTHWPRLKKDLWSFKFCLEPTIWSSRKTQSRYISDPQSTVFSKSAHLLYLWQKATICALFLGQNRWSENLFTPLIHISLVRIMSNFFFVEGRSTLNYSSFIQLWTLSKEACYQTLTLEGCRMERAFGMPVGHFTVLWLPGLWMLWMLARLEVTLLWYRPLCFSESFKCQLVSIRITWFFKGQGAVSRKPRKRFGPVKPLQNLEPCKYRAVLFTYPKDDGWFPSYKKFRAYTLHRF